MKKLNACARHTVKEFVYQDPLSVEKHFHMRLQGLSYSNPPAFSVPKSQKKEKGNIK